MRKVEECKSQELLFSLQSFSHKTELTYYFLYLAYNFVYLVRRKETKIPS